MPALLLARCAMDAAQVDSPASFAGLRVALVGRLAGMPRREAVQMLRARGATVCDARPQDADVVIVGEHELPLLDLAATLDEPLRRAVDAGRARLLTETQLWESLGLVDKAQNVHRLYTPAMLADLVQVPLAVIRRWHRRGLIVPARQVRRLPYFDFQEVATARRLAELLASGMSAQAIERRLEEIRRLMPGIERPLTQLAVIVEGKHLLLRKGEGLLDSAGQMRLDFEPSEAEQSLASSTAETTSTLPLAPPPSPVEHSPEQLCELAAELEEEGDLERAADMYRAALAAGGPKAETCFQLAELLYRQGEMAAARERYSMAIELDEDYVEARANLGCVFAETGREDLAIAAFEGALAFHPDYPDVHFHLARILDSQGEANRAAEHWRRFLALATDSPWADVARERLGQP